MNWTLGVQLLAGGGVMIAAMAALWALQRLIHDAGIVDVAWSAGLGFFAILMACTSGDGDSGRRALLAGLASAWAFRLSSHMLNDRVLGKPEAGRYQMMRNRLGDGVDRFFFAYYMMQTWFAILFALPFAAAAHNPAPFPAWTDFLAILIWAVATVGESIADAQLAKFRGDARNDRTTLRTGLWKYTRHPNYFFEWLHWWTYVLLAAGSGSAWLALLTGPVAMFLFLWYVSGIPHTEAQALRTRTDYAEYQRSTSAFLPWFPKQATPT